MRLPVRRSSSRLHVWFHALAALTLLISIAAPLAVAMPVAAQRGSNPPPLPAPVRVAAVGSFQTALGCPQDYDASCQLTELTDAGGGTWSAVLPIPPGDYALRIVASSDQDRSLGAGGDPDGADLTVSVSGSATGLYVAYDALTGAIDTEPVDQRLEVLTDNGDRIALAPSSGGGYVAFFDSPPGTYGIQIVVDDQPVVQDQIALDQPSRVVLETDASGTITALQTVDDTTLSVAKSDDAGSPLTGSCFAVLSTDGTLQGQACDADDGEDGTTTLRFANGLPSGSYDLNEVLTPDGQDEAEGQQVDLGPGGYAAEAVVGGDDDSGDAGDEPSDEGDEDVETDADESDQPGVEPAADEPVAGRVVLRATDNDGEALPGACFVLAELGIEACDDDGDGSVIFENVGAGFYTLIQTAAPEGYLANAESQVEVAAEGNRYRLTHEPADGASADDAETDAAAEPEETEEAEQPADQPAGEGNLEVSTQDENGQPVTGACFALTPRDEESTGQPVERCDGDDGSDDGEIVFDAIAAGRYRLDEATTPDGFQPADGQNVEIVADQTAPIAIDYRVAEGEPGTLVILVVDDAEEPVGETCFSLESDAATFENVCDQGNDGRLNIPEIPAGEYLVRQEQTAAENEIAEDETVIVPAGDVTELTIENPRTGGDETPAAEDADATETPDPGDDGTGTLLVIAEDATGSPLAGGCYAVAGAPGDAVCDGSTDDADPEDGRVQLENLPAGDYEIFEAQPPTGVEPNLDAVPVTVTADETARARFAAAGTEETPAPEETEEATDIPAIQAAGGGRVLVVARTDAGDAAADLCVTLDGAASYGPICDNATGDEDDEPGRILLAEIDPGPYTARFEAPSGVSLAANEAEQPIEALAGETARIEIALAAAETPEAEDEPGTLIILAEDANGDSLPGACYTVSNGGETFGPFCDQNLNGDVVVTGVTAGEQEIAQTTAPEGAPPPDETEQSVTVEAGAESALTFSHGAATGAVLVTLDADDQPLAGACVELANEETPLDPVCDAVDGSDDDDPEEGRILLENVPAGDYTLTVADAPEGFTAPEPEPVTVVSGETAEVALTLEAEAPASGTLTIQTVSDGGEPLAAACYTLTNPNGTFGPVCDEDGDGDVELTDVTPGEKTITQTTAPADAGAPEAAEQTVTVEAGTGAELTFTHGAAAGGLRIAVADAEGNPAAGGCYLVEGAQGLTACDDGDNDADPEPGAVLIDDLAPGDYVVSESQTPSSFQANDEQQTVTVDAAEQASVAFTATPEAETGSIELTAVDTDGALFETQPGACYLFTGADERPEICDNDENDANPANGVVRIDDVAVGIVQVSQSRAPEGVLAAADIEIEVTADEVAAVAMASDAVPEPVGSLVLLNQDADGNALGDGCFAIDGPTALEICDNGQNDPNSDLGAIGFGGIPAGTYSVSQTAIAEGFEAAETREIEVVADEETVEVFASAAVEAATGGVVLAAQDADGNPIEGQCFRLTRDGEELEQVCDNGDRDADPDVGAISLEALPEGVYAAEPILDDDDETLVDGDTDLAQAAIASVARRTFTVRRNQEPVRVVVNVPQRVTTGDLAITKQDDAGRALAGACFALLAGDDVVAEACDDGAGDGNGNPGQIRFETVESDTYTLRETEAPDGFEAAADQEVTVRRRTVTRVTVPNSPLPEIATLSVVTTDEQGNALTGACYSLLKGARTFGPVCDEADESDGTTNFSDVESGAYIVRQTRAPSADVAPAADQALLIVAGENREITVVNETRPGVIRIQKADDEGTLLGGACFAIEPDAGGDGYALCDDDANDGSPEPGTILLRGVLAGDYVAIETRAPAGFQPGADQAVTVVANRRVDLVFANVPLPPPPQQGNLTIYKVDVNNQLLPGACFALIQDGATTAGPRCDGADGARDGVISFTGIGVGDYTLRETVRPSAGYQPLEDITVSIALNETLEIAVENRLRPGRITVRKTDIDGDPLRGACFDLTEDDAEAACTDDGGLVTFSGLTPGQYTLTETEAPSGYLEAAPVEAIVVNPGATTTVDVVNELAPPPPDTGSIQVLKFYCPAGEAGEGTEFVDSSDPSGSRLARTAGCTPGNAEFELIAASGEGGPGDFVTGDDGRYQTTLRAGDYTLAELVPDLAGDAAEEVVIYVNQLTTVVVLNFVAPPAPEPAAIDVVKYTCAPGFEGNVFADFVEVCAADENLTNSVTFRLAGATQARRITGEGGLQGQTSFLGLPAGDYVLREEPPDVALTVYAFCGLDPNAPDLRRVGDDIAFSLGAGQRLTCYWFNVPDDLTETSGAIVVHKYGCPVSRAPAGFAWYEECDPQGPGVPFSLALLDGDEYVPQAEGVTNGDGLVRFSRLEPGTYQLKEVGAEWCHAESDSVNARGDVIVREGARANVWIFNCLGTQSPPNTGTGPGGGLPGTGGAPAALLGLVWPLVGLFAFEAYRRRRWAA